MCLLPHCKTTGEKSALSSVGCEWYKWMNELLCHWMIICVLVCQQKQKRRAKFIQVHKPEERNERQLFSRCTWLIAMIGCDKRIDICSNNMISTKIDVFLSLYLLMAKIWKLYQSWTINHWPYLTQAERCQWLILQCPYCKGFTVT